MPTWQIFGATGFQYPDVLRNHLGYEKRYDVIDESDVELKTGKRKVLADPMAFHTFECDDAVQAMRVMDHIRRVGLKAFRQDGPVVKEETGIWRFKGSNHYMIQQSHAIGMSLDTIKKLINNDQVYRVNTLLSQLAAKYTQTRGNGTVAVLMPQERASYRDTLRACEGELKKLHVMGAAVEVMLNEGWRSIGEDAPPRSAGVVLHRDEPTPPPLEPETQHKSNQKPHRQETAR